LIVIPFAPAIKSFKAPRQMTTEFVNFVLLPRKLPPQRLIYTNLQCDHTYNIETKVLLALHLPCDLHSVSSGTKFLNDSEFSDSHVAMYTPT
jgi:hypothetical protein